MKLIEYMKRRALLAILCLSGCFLLWLLLQQWVASERKNAEMVCHQVYIQQSLNKEVAEKKELIKNADYKMEVLSRADYSFDDLLKLMYTGEL